MLQTLLKIGKWQSEGKSRWDRFFDLPKDEQADRRGNPIQNYSLSILFDLDKGQVLIDREGLRAYDPDNVKKLFPLKIKGGNNKAIYATVPSNKLVQLYKTFFGKENEETECGELREAIIRTNPSILNERYSNLLSEIFNLKDQFICQVKNDKGAIDFKTINSKLGLGRNQKVVVVFISIKANEYGISEPQPFSELEEYQKFLEVAFFEETKAAAKKEQLCYASGEMLDDIDISRLEDRYSLNKMFVTTTINYATQFDKRKFAKNYQLSLYNQELLDYASDFLLNKGYTIPIAGVNHVIIPEFSKHSKIDLSLVLDGIHLKSDLLFNVHKLRTQVSNEIDDWINEEEVYWLNFMAFESDGNFFKSIGVIKDVSNFHFNKILNAFHEIDKNFQNLEYIDWQNIMTNYGKHRDLNFNSLFQIIPVRKDKEKTNKALELFKAILESRRVSKESLLAIPLIRDHYSAA